MSQPVAVVKAGAHALLGGLTCGVPPHVHEPPPLPQS